jgi:phosphoribosyl-dephospho-CoA transferase
MLVWPSAPPTAEGGPPRQRSVDAWHRGGKPFVVGQHRHAGTGFVSLGLCLPRPDAYTPPGRVGSFAPADGLDRAEPPPRVTDVAAAAKAHDIAGRHVVDLVAERASKSDLEIRVFGSWMWLWVTGAGDGAYVSADSDLDVVVVVSDAVEARAACEVLASCEREVEGRVDGEVAIEGTGDVHWRELMTGTDPVVVKSIDGPRLMSRDLLWC